MAESELEHAKALLQAKRYEDARALLLTIDHPTADKWLTRLNEMSASRAGKLDKIDPPTSKTKTLADKLRESPVKMESTSLIGSLLSQKSKSKVETAFDQRANTHVKKGSNSSAYLLIIILFGLLLIAFASRSGPKSNGDTASMLSVQPAIIEIQDEFNTGLSENFLAATRKSISQYGHITYYDAKVNNQSRVEIDTEINLDILKNNRGTALAVIESIFRLYAQEFSDQSAGAITISVLWQRQNRRCADNAGMGYEIMKTISWDKASQSDIFRAINHLTYGDLPGETYADIAWAPDESGYSECNL